MKRVLVCDDDESILDVIKIVLENDYKVETVSSAKKILEKAKKYLPHLILLDHTMPTIEMGKIVSLIKKELKNTPIILVSATDGLEKKAKRLQVADFINKPFDMNELLKKVKQCIR